MGVMCKLCLLINSRVVLRIHMMSWVGGMYTLHVQYGEEGDIVCLLWC